MKLNIIFKQIDCNTYCFYSVAMRSKSFDVRGKLMDFLSSNNNSAKNEKSNSGSKRYRNMAPVFAIDDDNNQDSEGI